MGGAEMCCSLESTANKFRGDLYQIQAFQIADPLANDEIVAKWLADNQDINSTQNRSLMRLKLGDIYYYSTWVESVPEGRGFVYKPGVLFFDGCFKKGMPDGDAFVTFFNQKCEYQGEVKGWRAHGKGKLSNKNSKYIIEGDWENSKLQNCVITFQEDPNILTIKIIHSQKKIGLINYRDNRVFEGSMDTRKLLPHGIGKIKFPQKSSKIQYEGEWYNGQMIGKGKVIYRNKSFYEGQFFNGQREGYGRFTYENGKYFQGYWHRGKQLGAGAVYSILGEPLQYGLWENGIFVKQITKKQWQEQSEIDKSKHSGMFDGQDFIKQDHYQIKITQSKIEQSTD